MGNYELGPFRNHPTYILEQMWGLLGVIFLLIIQNAGAVAGVARLTQEGKKLEALLLFAGSWLLLLLMVGWFINRWYRTTITLKDYTLTIQRNTINRMVNSISVKNISN